MKTTLEKGHAAGYKQESQVCVVFVTYCANILFNSQKSSCMKYVK